IGNHRIEATGISCPSFDLRSYTRNATLAVTTLFNYTDASNTSAANGFDIPRTVINSKYLSIIDHRSRNGTFSSTITGTIKNNSTQDVHLFEFMQYYMIKTRN